MSKLVSTNSSKELLKLVKQNLYNKNTNTIDLEWGKEITQQVIDMMPIKKEDLNYIRESDGFSMLHFANTSHNPYLVALFLFLKVDLSYSGSNCVAPRKFIENTQYLVEGMSEDLYDPRGFLAKEWIIKLNNVEESKARESVSSAQTEAASVTDLIVNEELNLVGDILIGDVVDG